MARREHVVEVIDGNTFKTEAHTVRLEGVEAPTLSQPGGLEARSWLEVTAMFYLRIHSLEQEANTWQR